MFQSNSQRRRRGGFTLLEAAVYTGLLAILAGPMVSVMIISTRSTVEATALNGALERNRVVAFRVAETLRTAMADTIVVGAGGQSVTFTLPDSYDGTAW